MNSIRDYRSLLVDFFKFYSEFDFGGQVISTYFGRAIPRLSYPKGDKDLEKLIENGQVINFRFAPVSIADNLNLSFNCAHGVGAKRLKKFIPFCKEAVEILKENLFN